MGFLSELLSPTGKYSAAPWTLWETGNFWGRLSPSGLDMPSASPAVLRLRLLHKPCSPPELHPHSPNPPGGFCQLPLPGTGWALGQEWAEHRAPSQGYSSRFYPENLLLLWDRRTASCITLQSSKSIVYSCTSCPGLGFTNQNVDFSHQRPFFSSSPVSPLPGSVRASTEWGKGGVLLRKHGEKTLINIVKY